MRRATLLAASIVLLSVFAVPAHAHQPGGCGRVVVFAIPGITWSDVARVQPPELLEAVSEGAIGSLSVRTVTSRTSYASGFATIGAGARVDGGRSTGYVEGTPPGTGSAEVTAAGVREMRSLLDEAGYTTVKPGALATALEGKPVAAFGNSDLGVEPPVPVGRGQWSLLAAMDEAGHVDLAATGRDLLSPADAPYGVALDPDEMAGALEALEVPCLTAMIDAGDPTRADAAAANLGVHEEEATDEALSRADALLRDVRERLHPHSDLLLIVSPTSPAWDDDVHFGVAVVVGPGFTAGSLLQSPSTRRAGLVTLPDIAPTILRHHGAPRPSSMIGREMYTRPTTDADRIAAQVALDREAVLIDALRAPVSTGFVVAQVLLYAVVAWMLRRRGRKEPAERLQPPRAPVIAALGVVAFPLATYLSGLGDQLGGGAVGLVIRLLVLDAMIVTATCITLRSPFDRLLGVTGLTYLVLVVDLVTGAHLQVNTVFSYSPLVAGRFAGIGNIAYAVLAATTVITAALLVHRERASRRSLSIAAGLFVVAVVADAAPQFGADVGGILALVPGLSVTWLLLADRRPRLRTILLIALGAVAAVAVFLAIDLAQPAESRTHLARLFEDVRGRGPSVFVDAIRRKVQTNLRVFGSTIWTYLVPPALAAIGWLLVRPRNRWQRVAERYPRLRAGLVACLIVAVLGFAVNDSGIVVPAMMLSFLVPLALLMHLSLEQER